MKPEYQRYMSHAVLEILRVTRDGRTHEVSDHGSAGPQELWTIRQAFKGLSDSVRWTESKTQPVCP
jgi:hypothetical protein